MIAAKRAGQSSSNLSDGDKDSLKIKDAANYASDSVRKKRQEIEARSSVRC